MESSRGQAANCDLRFEESIFIRGQKLEAGHSGEKGLDWEPLKSLPKPQKLVSREFYLGRCHWRWMKVEWRRPQSLHNLSLKKPPFRIEDAIASRCSLNWLASPKWMIIMKMMAQRDILLLFGSFSARSIFVYDFSYTTKDDQIFSQNSMFESQIQIWSPFFETLYRRYFSRERTSQSCL